MISILTPARLALTGAVLSVLLALPGAYAAEEPAAAKAGATTASGSLVFVVVDTDRIRRESAVGKSIDAQAEKYGKAMEDENRKDETPLRAEEQEVQKLRGTLPPDQFAERARAFEQKVAEMQRTGLKRRQAFDKSFNTAVAKVRQSIVEATRDVAAGHNADVVLLSQALLLFNTKLDVTEEVITLLNKRVTQVEFPPPKIEPDAPGSTSAVVPAPSDGDKKAKPKTLQLSPQPNQ